MKYSISIILIIILFSCTKPVPDALQKEFSCSNVVLEKTEIVQDFQKKFQLQIPKKWNKKFFYNEYQTSLMTADSLLPLTKSFILDVSLNNGDLKVDDNIKNTVIRNIISKEHLRINKFGIGKFHKKPSVWLLAEGTRNELPFHLFKLLSKKDAKTYYQIEAQIYGDSLVNERVCKIISIVESLKEVSEN